MKKSDVLKYYDGNCAAAARAIGCNRVTAWSWGERIPMERAVMFDYVTRGKLKFDVRDYDSDRVWARARGKTPRRVRKRRRSPTTPAAADAPT